MACIEIHRNRTFVHLVSLGYDVSGSTFRSEIRETRSPTSRLIASIDIDLVEDGSTGELRLSLDNSITGSIGDNVGFMDILREEGGEPYSVLETPLVVCFTDFPTQPTPDS